MPSKWFRRTEKMKYCNQVLLSRTLLLFEWENLAKRMKIWRRNGKKEIKLSLEEHLTIISQCRTYDSFCNLQKRICKQNWSVSTDDVPIKQINMCTCQLPNKMEIKYNLKHCRQIMLKCMIDLSTELVRSVLFQFLESYPHHKVASLSCSIFVNYIWKNKVSLYLQLFHQYF